MAEKPSTPGIPVPLGRTRGSADGGRRYRPLRVDFDTRNVVLDLAIQDDWDPDNKALWEENKQQIRASLIAELGPMDAELKFSNYREMGPAPWSVVSGHTTLLRQTRSAFAHGDHFPALVGACALGERILHELIHALRADYLNHRGTTRKVRNGKLGNEWGTLITVLHRWDVFDDRTAQVFRRLEQYRHQAVHFEPELEASAREPALAALLALQEIVERIFQPHGGPPRYIADTPGASFLALDAEQEPLVQRMFVPNCVLVSPVYYVTQDPASPTGWTVYDDPNYSCEPLTDDEFVNRLRASDGA